MKKLQYFYISYIYEQIVTQKMGYKGLQSQSMTYFFKYVLSYIVYNALNNITRDLIANNLKWMAFFSYELSMFCDQIL